MRVQAPRGPSSVHHAQSLVVSKDMHYPLIRITLIECWCVHIRYQTRIHAWMCVSVCVCVRTRYEKCINGVAVCVHVCMYVCMCVCLLYENSSHDVGVCVGMCMSVYLYNVHSKFDIITASIVFICMYVYICICMYVIVIVKLYLYT